MLKRITTLTVDQQGEITAGTRLSPGTYVVSKDTPRRTIPLVSRSKLANWIDRCVLGDLTTLHDGIRIDAGPEHFCVSDFVSPLQKVERFLGSPEPAVHQRQMIRRNMPARGE